MGCGPIHVAVWCGPIRCAVGCVPICAAMGCGPIRAAMGCGPIRVAVGCGLIRAAVGCGPIRAVLPPAVGFGPGHGVHVCGESGRHRRGVSRLRPRHPPHVVLSSRLRDRHQDDSGALLPQRTGAYGRQ